MIFHDASRCEKQIFRNTMLEQESTLNVVFDNPILTIVFLALTEGR